MKERKTLIRRISISSRSPPMKLHKRRLLEEKRLHRCLSHRLSMKYLSTLFITIDPTTAIKALSTQKFLSQLLKLSLNRNGSYWWCLSNSNFANENRKWWKFSHHKNLEIRMWLRWEFGNTGEYFSSIHWCGNEKNVTRLCAKSLMVLLSHLRDKNLLWQNDSKLWKRSRTWNRGRPNFSCSIKRKRK